MIFLRAAIMTGLACACLSSLGLSQRLIGQPTRLNPSQPRAYLDSGELAAASAKTDGQLREARQMLAMGIVLGVAGEDNQLASSCAIALASTHPDETDLRQRLWDYALMLDPQRVSQWATHRPDDASLRTAHQAAECIRLARNAERHEARELLGQPAVEIAIRESARRLGFDQDEQDEVLRMLYRMSEDRERDPCNGNYFDTRVEDGQSVRVVCRKHIHPIGAAEGGRSLAMLLAIELDCIGPSSAGQEWGGESAMRRMQPVADPDIEWLKTTYGIDPDKPAFSNGRWGA
ncbi:MAG: hypothetical protein ACX94C_07160 [Phycisphaerales bacterium]